MIEIVDSERVRVIRLNRPEVKNAMNEALWDATAEAFIDAEQSPSIAVVVLTGTGDSFSAGQDVREMMLGAAGALRRGKHGFQGLAERLACFPKPFLCAVNGVGVGFGATVVGLADLVFMSRTAQLKCPFTSLEIVPEMASSYTFPQLIGRQQAFWALLSSDWLSAERCKEMGLVYEVCEPDDLMETTIRHGRMLAAYPISSLVASKRLILDAMVDQVTAAAPRKRRLEEPLGRAGECRGNWCLSEKRSPDFWSVE